MEDTFTIGEAAAELGIPASTIRYYDKNGLIPNQRRTGDGRRVFGEDDLEWMRFIGRLKASGMPIREIRAYVELEIQGDSTIAERRRIVYERRRIVDEKLDELRLARDFIEYKCWYYDVATETGTCDIPKNMPYEELPENIRRIKDKCGISRY